MLKFDLAWGHILALGLANFLLGWFWYSPLFLGNVWMKALKIKRPKKMTPAQKSQMLWLMGTAAVSAVLMSLGAQVLVHSLGAADFASGAQIGLFVGVVFVVAHAAGSLFEGRPILVWGIGALHALVILILNGGVHAVWR